MDAGLLQAVSPMVMGRSSNTMVVTPAPSGRVCVVSFAHRPHLHRTAGGSHDRQDPPVVVGQRGLVNAAAAVRDVPVRPLGAGRPGQEPLRAKLVKLADRGWLHKRDDGKFTARL